MAVCSIWWPRERVDGVILSQEAISYIEKLPKPGREICRWLHSYLETKGCASYVKTIYVGYEINGEMVAAIYGYRDIVEIALSLAEDHESELLRDATHLKWRTLPVSIVVDDSVDRQLIHELIDESCERIISSTHRVDRGSEFFIKVKKGKIDRRR